MRISKLFLLSVFSLTLFSYSFGQLKEIDSEEYLNASRNAYSKSRTVSRRTVQEIKGFRSEKPYSETWTYEYQLPDRVRYLKIDTFAGRTRRAEQINIGDRKYCRKDEGEWEISQSFCIGGSAFGGLTNIISEKYVRERTKQGREEIVCYSSYTTYKNIYSKSANPDEVSYSESEFWLNKDGMLVRSVTRMGVVGAFDPTYEMTETYEYDPNIKIEAPIK